METYIEALSYDPVTLRVVETATIQVEPDPEYAEEEMFHWLASHEASGYGVMYLYHNIDASVMDADPNIDQNGYGV